MAAPLDLVERWTQVHNPPAPNPAANPLVGQDVYDQQSALANQAYQQALAQLAAQRDNAYHDARLLGGAKGGAVDPHNQYGQYQQMLGAQGSQLDSDRASSLARGLVGHGLAAQGQSGLRNIFGSQDLQFQRQVSNIGQNFAWGSQQA